MSSLSWSCDSLGIWTGHSIVWKEYQNTMYKYSSFQYLWFYNFTHTYADLISMMTQIFFFNLRQFLLGTSYYKLTCTFYATRWTLYLLYCHETKGSKTYLILKEHSSLFISTWDVVYIRTSWSEAAHCSSLNTTYYTLYLTSSFYTFFNVHQSSIQRLIHLNQTSHVIYSLATHK